MQEAEYIWNVPIDKASEGFKKPSRWKNERGKDRKAGFELEFAGITLQTCADAIKDLYGGSIDFEHSLRCEVKNTTVGTFTVELDSQLMQNLADNLENKKNKIFTGEITATSDVLKEVSQIAGYIAEKLVPVEIVTPPLAFEQFPKLEKLREVLCLNNAEGTRSSLTNAFGMHINPEVPSCTNKDILNYLQSFLVLYPWLKQVMAIDLSRRILPYIDPFPKDYIKIVLEDSYNPSLDELIDDYLEYNPTRNRALDLLPLFKHLRPEKIQSLPENNRKKVKARPAFHYRLPNCEIDDEEWRIARDWNYWVEVEELAANQDKLLGITQEYLYFLNDPFYIFSNEWSIYINKQLNHG